VKGLVICGDVPLYDFFYPHVLFVGWVGDFLKIASALGCGIFHPHPPVI
jgi:hypothetical protein